MRNKPEKYNFRTYTACKTFLLASGFEWSDDLEAFYNATSDTLALIWHNSFASEGDENSYGIAYE